jgi:hypothetical protein
LEASGELVGKDMRPDDVLHFRVLGCLLGGDLTVEGRLLPGLDLVLVDHLNVDLMMMNTKGLG